MRGVKRFPWRSSATSLSVGAVVFAIVLAGGLAVAVTRGQKWSATSSDVVLPSSRLDAATSAGYYESLSRGQVVATVAEIFRLRRLKTSAADRLHLSPSQRAALGVDIQAVPETALVRILVTSPEREVAGRMADAMLAEANAYVGSGWSDGRPLAPGQGAARGPGGQLLSPFTLTPVSAGAGNEDRVGIGWLQFAVVALFVALTAGVAAHQATQQLVRLAPARPPAARSAAEPGDVHGPGNGAVHGWTEPPDVRFPPKRAKRS